MSEAENDEDHTIEVIAFYVIDNDGKHDGKKKHHVDRLVLELVHQILFDKVRAKGIVLGCPMKNKPLIDFFGSEEYKPEEASMKDFVSNLTVPQHFRKYVKVKSNAIKTYVERITDALTIFNSQCLYLWTTFVSRYR